MADEQSSDNYDDKKALAAAYSKFYAGPDQRLAIQTKSHIDAPEIKADLARARGGADVVSDHEMSVLTGTDTRVYRPNPLGPEQPKYEELFKPMLAQIDRKVATGVWSPEDQSGQDAQIKLIAAKTGLDENQVQAIAKRYEIDATEENKVLGQNFGAAPPTPLKDEIAATLKKRALHQPITPDENTKLQANLVQFGKDEHYAPGAVQDEVAMFMARTQEAVTSRRISAAISYSEEAQRIHTGHGEAFIYPNVTMDRERAAVPQMKEGDTRATLSAWFINPDDPPPRMPPGGAALGDFLISLHESEHLSRRGDTIAPKTLSPGAQEQAGEIDADRAVIRYLDNERNPAAKNYWLQARQVDSFTSGVVSGDASHDTATFLRLQEATGEQLDLDKFRVEKRELLRRIAAQGDLQPTNEDYGRARTADVMGAVRDVLADDKAEKDPTKKLSTMQRAEAESFLKDAGAMGYVANPDYPKPKTADAAPSTAKPATSALPAPKA